MQEKGKDPQLRIISAKTLTDPPQRCEFLDKEAIIGVVSEAGLEIYRVKPQFERIALITSTELGNSNVRDFIIDPIGQLVIVSTDKPKVQVFKLTEDEDRRPYIIFNDADSPVIGLNVMKTKYNVKSSYHSFQRLNDSDVSIQETSYNVAEKIFKSSFTHLFTIKENLNKIQKLESLIDQKNQIYILYSVDGKKIKASLNSLIDLFTLDLSEHVESRDFQILSIDQSECLGRLNVIARVDKENGTSDFVNVVLGFKQLSENIDEFFCLNYSLALVKEFFLNLKLGFFNAKTKFKDIGKRVSGFLGELHIDEPENLTELRWFIKLGHRSTENLPSFFEILDMKKLAEFHQFVLQNFSIVEDFVSESLRPGLSKIQVILEDTKRIIIGLNIRDNNLMEITTLEGFMNTVRLLSRAIDRLFYRISAKKLELLNFFLFLFKWKMKNSANLKFTENPEYLKYHNALLDFKLLLQYLDSQASICLDDLAADCDTELLVHPTEPRQDVSLSTELVDKFKSLQVKLGLPVTDGTSESDGNHMALETGECIRDLFRKVDTGFAALNKSLKGSFLNSVIRLERSVILDGPSDAQITFLGNNAPIRFLLMKAEQDCIDLVIREKDGFRTISLNLPQGLASRISHLVLDSHRTELVFAVYNVIDNNFDMKCINISAALHPQRDERTASLEDHLRRAELSVGEADVRFKADLSFKAISLVKFNGNETWLVVKENQLSILE